MENNRRGNEIFLGVIGVATLVVAIIGATFAFFSASASSDNNAIAVNSTSLSLGFDDQTHRNLKVHLIPASEMVATYAALNQKEVEPQSGNAQCEDDNGNEVCGVYEFTVSNPAGSTTVQSISYSLDVAVNGFTNLKYKIYEGSSSDQSVTNASTPVISAQLFPQADDSNNNPVALTALNTTLTTTSPSNSKTYTMVIWLDETGYNQSAEVASENETAEANQQFAATLTVTSGTGQGVTGKIQASESQQNPS